MYNIQTMINVFSKMHITLYIFFLSYLLKDFLEIIVKGKRGDNKLSLWKEAYLTVSCNLTSDHIAIY